MWYAHGPDKHKELAAKIARLPKPREIIDLERLIDSKRGVHAALSETLDTARRAVLRATVQETVAETSSFMRLSKHDAAVKRKQMNARPVLRETEEDGFGEAPDYHFSRREQAAARMRNKANKAGPERPHPKAEVTLETYAARRGEKALATAARAALFVPAKDHFADQYHATNDKLGWSKMDEALNIEAQAWRITKRERAERLNAHYAASTNITVAIRRKSGIYRPTRADLIRHLDM